MAHNLMVDEKTGEAAIAYVGDLPWHGLGQRFGDENRPMCAADAIKLAHLDYEVVKTPIYVEAGDSKIKVPGKFATVRKDKLDAGDPRPFGIVSNVYEPLQNRDAFTFFDKVIGEGKAIYHTAGALGYGERVWILAKLPEDLDVAGDIMEPYLLLENTHDGSSAIRALLTTVRVVCNNTLTAALQSAESSVSIRHTTNAAEKFEEAATILGIATEQAKKQEAAARLLAKVDVNSMRLQTYFESVYPRPEPNEDGEVTKRRLNHHEGRMQALTELFEAGPGSDLPAARGTLWGAFNAVTDHVDHGGMRGHRGNGERRMRSAVFGTGAAIKRKAQETALEFAGSWN